MTGKRLFVFDLDGTLYRGTEVIAEALTTVHELHRAQHAIAYLTNNSGTSIQQLETNLKGMGYPVEPGSVWNSGAAAAQHLAAAGLRRVFVVGESDLFMTLRDGGIATTNHSEDPLVWKGAQAVVVGICRQATYAWIDAAMQAIRAGAKFVACNPDPVFPLEGGTLQPGAGAIVAAIQCCSETDPLLIGKPEPTMLIQLSEKLGFERSDVVMVGDRDDTDMEAARRAGVLGMLMSGSSDYAELLSL